MDLDLNLFVEMAYALGIGLLIGLERSLVVASENSDDLANGAGDQAGADSGPVEALGARTFAVVSLLGFAAALASQTLPLVAPVTLAGVGILVIAMYFRTREFGIGITTEAALIATGVLGMLCYHHHRAAGVIALLLTVLLASKRFAHQTIRKMRRVELTDTLKFLVVIMIVLPLLPARPLDPYGAFNPYKVGVLVVLISGISFVGYFLTRILGAQKGIGLTGILGGLTSSTAVTAAMAGEAKANPGLRPICAFSTVAANATMFVRVLVVVALLDRALAQQLAWPVGAMAGVALVAAVWLWLVASKSQPSGDEASSEVKLKNPFSVAPALKFAAFFVVVLFAVRLAKIHLGDQGLFAAAALSGLADVDAISLSVAEQTRDASLICRTGAIAITIAVVANSIVKSAIAFSSGGMRFGAIVAASLGAATLVGLAVAFLV